MTYQEANQKGRALLEEKHIEDASVDAWLLLEFVTGMNRTRLSGGENGYLFSILPGLRSSWAWISA